MDFIWQSAVDWATTFAAAHFYISPFYYWVFVGIGTILATTAAGWYFPVLRSLSGAIVMAVIAGLYGYRRGEKDAEAHEAKVHKAKPVAPKKQSTDWFGQW